jgi:hypothetical protein
LATYSRIKVGSVFGRLTVKAKSEKVNFRTAWTCLCLCGKEKVILAQSLKNGATASCGCLHKEILVGLRTKYLQKAGEVVGKKFNQWLVVDLLPRRSKNGGVYFLCRCDCGQEREVASDGLLRGSSKSCGLCGSRKNPVCKFGHTVVEWGGRTPTGACKACVKHKSLLNHYGISLEEYLALGESQEWKCAVCGRALSKGIGPQGFRAIHQGVLEGRPEVDHEHGGKTVDKKYVRGILCGGRWAGCNRRMGKVDDPQWLSRVLAYLNKPPAREFFTKRTKV